MMAIETAENVSQIYRTRFEDTGLAKRDRVWKTLCRSYFNQRVVQSGSILDLACGYGEFITTST